MPNLKERGELLKQAAEIFDKLDSGAGMKSPHDTTEPGKVDVSYGKWHAKISGEKVTAILFLATCAGFLGYLIYQAQQIIVAHADETKAQMRQVSEEIKASRETQEAMIYVISLPQEARERLNITRPRKLTQMQQ